MTNDIPKIDGEEVDPEYLKGSGFWRERKLGVAYPSFASRSKEEIMRERIRMGLYNLDFLPEEFLVFKTSGTVSLGYTAAKKILNYLYSQGVKLTNGERYRFEEKCPYCDEKFLTIIGGAEHNGGKPVYDHIVSVHNE